MIFYVLTLFPEMVSDALNHSIIKRAVDDGLITINCINIRDFTEDKHNRVDDAPYGGGAGMVMMPAPAFAACEYARSLAGEDTPVIYMSPRGKTYNQRKAEELSRLDKIILLCGHYEGIDQRAVDLCVTEEISVGDYILTGGEIAALAVIDSVSRLIPGVLGKEESAAEESFSRENNNLLEYPHYTRPAVFMDIPVPEILLSGHHKKIAEWRFNQSISITKQSRPDLL